MIRGKLGVLFLVLAMGGCASTPEPVAQIDTRLAGYFTQSPLDEGGREAALRVGVGVVPSEAIGAQDESTRLGMIAAVRAALDKARPGVSVRPIDDSYLKAGRGLANLRKTGQLFGVDTVVLLSLDRHFQPAEAPGLVRVGTATGARDVYLSAQTLLTYIDMAVIDLASGQVTDARQVSSELGVDAKTWGDARLRRRAEADATAQALQSLQAAVREDWVPAGR